jgi:hypothetical protein
MKSNTSGERIKASEALNQIYEQIKLLQLEYERSNRDLQFRFTVLANLQERSIALTSIIQQGDRILTDEEAAELAPTNLRPEKVKTSNK